MIKTKSIRLLMAERGIAGPAELSRRLNLTPTRMSQILNNKVPGFSSKTVEKICDVLDCQPGDFLEYVRDPDARIKEQRQDEVRRELQGGRGVKTYEVDRKDSKK